MKVDKNEDNTYHFEFNLRFDFKMIFAIFLFFLCIISMGITIGAIYINNKYQKKYEFVISEMQKEATRTNVKYVQYKKLMEELDLNMEHEDSIGFREHLR
jgi:hypothetical protein